MSDNCLRCGNGISDNTICIQCGYISVSDKYSEKLKRFTDVYSDKKEMDKVYEDLNNERKTQCWIWYFFPEPRSGLNRTFSLGNNTIKFSIEDDDEAREFLKNKEIRYKYKEMITKFISVLKKKKQYFNSSDDRRKMHSSINYFLDITKDNYDTEVHDLLTELKSEANL